MLDSPFPVDQRVIVDLSLIERFDSLDRVRQGCEAIRENRPQTYSCAIKSDLFMMVGSYRSFGIKIHNRI